MKRKLSSLLVSTLLFAMIVGSFGNVFANDNTSDTIYSAKELAQFNINSLEDDLTLDAALKKYPIIKSIYYVGMSDAEAKSMGIDVSKKTTNVKKLVDASDINAKEYLSCLNAMRPEAMKAQEKYALSLSEQKLIGDDILDVLAASAYGVAWRYVSTSSTGTNCYVYALGGTGFYNPGDYAYYNGATYTDSSTVNDVVDYMIADAQRDRKTARTISSATASINSDEYRIVTRVGYHNVSGYGWTWDYHWMRQTSSGGWCHKQGQLSSADLGNINPSTYSWDLGSLYTNFYDSATKYIATPKLSACNY